MSAIAVTPVALGAWVHNALAGKNPSAALHLTLTAFGGGPEVSDNTPAFRAALRRLAEHDGGVLNIGSGTYRFASASLAQSGILLPSNVTIRGAGSGRSILQVTGVAACNLFVGINRSHIVIELLSIIGNSVAPITGSYGTGSAIRWILGTNATIKVTGFTVRDVHLENFAGPYWVDIENDAPEGLMLTMNTISLKRITFMTRIGNSIAPSDVRLNAAVICINGYSGAIRGIRITKLTGDARHIKTGIILYHRVTDAILDAVTIHSSGIAGATDDAGAYAVQLYDSHYRMSFVTLSNIVIRAPRSVGIYVAGGRGITIVNPRISGQTDSQAGTLPKGAIVFNGTLDWRMTGGEFSDNWRDLDIAAPARGSPEAPEPVQGHVSGVRADGSVNGVAIRYAAGHVAAGITFSDCQWRTKMRTVFIQNSDRLPVVGPPAVGGYINDLTFENCRFEAGEGHRAIDLWGDSGSPAGGYTITSCVLVGSNPLYARNQTGKLVVDGCTITDLGTLPGAAAATMIDCPNLDVRNSTFRSPGRDGIGIDLAGSTGSIRNLHFQNCTRVLPAAIVPPQLGRSRPSFAGYPAQHVQNLEPADGEAAAWACVGGTSWQDAKTHGSRQS